MEHFSDLFQNLIEATRKHEQYREKECVNMIASEGLKSPAVNQILCFSHDLAARYAEGENDMEGHVKKRYYQGQRYISKIEDYATDLMKSLFKADWADVRLVSGTHANLATFKGLSLNLSRNPLFGKCTSALDNTAFSHDRLCHFLPPRIWLLGHVRSKGFG